MSSTSQRLDAAIAGLRAVVAGQRAGDVESETLDFKEEAGSVTRGQRKPIGPRNEAAAKALAASAACFATSASGGVIVVGVDDKRSGPEAIVGAALEREWLRERIHRLTTPGLAVEIHEAQEAGKRVYLIDVAPQLSEVYCEGRLRTRVGTNCVELTGDHARGFLEQRNRYDWSAEDSGLSLSDTDADALRTAHGAYRARTGSTAPNDAELIRRLGGALSDGDDPRLNRAAALLLCAHSIGGEIDVQVKVNESSPSLLRATYGPPFVLAIEAAWELMDRVVSARSEIVGLQRREVRDLPTAATREALINAISHRDYRLDTSPITLLLLGTPTRRLTVHSPGSLPPGVTLSRLIATPSRPRNPCLARALRALGYGEGEGVGIDRMYGSMLRDGHEPPDIRDEDRCVTVRLRGGQPDTGFAALISEAEHSEPEFVDDFRVPLAFELLRRATPLKSSHLAEAAQCPESDALALLRSLERLGYVAGVSNRSNAFRLAPRTEAVLASRLQYALRRSLDDHLAVVNEFLRGHATIGRAEAAEILGVTPTRASQVLGGLTRRGDLVTEGAARGRGVRYRKNR